MKRLIRHTITFLVVLAISVATVSAQTDGITLAWDPNDTSEQVTEYRLYYKTGPSGPPYNGVGLNQGDSPIIIPVADLADENSPEIDLTGLIPGVAYYFVVTAFNGDESGYSNEVPFTYGLPVDSDNDGYTTDQGDCNDNDAAIHPEATETCGDGIDQDCSGEDGPCEDRDGDGVVPPRTATTTTSTPTPGRPKSSATASTRAATGWTSASTATPMTTGTVRTTTAPALWCSAAIATTAT